MPGGRLAIRPRGGDLGSGHLTYTEAQEGTALTSLRAMLLGVTIVMLAVGLTTPRQAAGGSIKGTVVLKGASPELRKLAVTIDQYVCGKEKSPEDLLVSPQGGIRNAVVWLDKAPAGAAGGALPSTTTMDPKECSFAPPAVIVPA